MGKNLDESNQEALVRIVDKKIIPELSKIIGTIPDKFPAVLRQCSRVHSVVSGQILLDSGAANEGHLLFVDNTTLRSFYYDEKNERERTSRLGIRNDVIVDVNSFLYGTDRLEQVQALDDGKVLSINFANLKTILHDFPEMNKVLLHFKAASDKEYAYYQHLLKVSVDERVQIYIGDHPTLPTRINHDYIAQYLDIDRSSFSLAYKRYRGKK